MAEFPHMPLATDAYLGDTKHLTTIQHGAYLLLLMAMWRAGGTLPDDDKLLARYAGLTGGQWARMSGTIRGFFVSSGGMISQGRLTDELNFVRQHRKTQSDNARARWRKLKGNGDAAAMPSQSRGNAPTPTLYSDTKVSAADAPLDVRSALFKEGLESLCRQTGKSQSSGRALIGKWLKAAKDDAAKVLVKIRQAEADQVADAVAWIEAALRDRDEYRFVFGRM
jgi:uncharacterized protein YdaU (DUF1376 family)